MTPAAPRRAKTRAFPALCKVFFWQRIPTATHAALLPRRRRDGTPLYSHRGAALRSPVSFRDDLEALGYTLLALSAGSLPWEALALAQLPKKVCAVMFIIDRQS